MRIDVDYIYAHLIWAYVFTIYIIIVVAFILHGYANRGRK